jgi:hypothetical protein
MSVTNTKQFIVPRAAPPNPFLNSGTFYFGAHVSVKARVARDSAKMRDSEARTMRTHVSMQAVAHQCQDDAMQPPSLLKGGAQGAGLKVAFRAQAKPLEQKNMVQVAFRGSDSLAPKKVCIHSTSIGLSRILRAALPNMMTNVYLNTLAGGM